MSRKTGGEGFRREPPKQFMGHDEKWSSADDRFLVEHSTKMRYHEVDVELGKVRGSSSDRRSYFLECLHDARQTVQYAALKPILKQMIRTYRYTHDMTPQQIADRMGLQVLSVRATLGEALE